MSILKPITIFTLLYLFYPPKAYAYLDPGTGSYLIQILIGLALGGLYLLRLYWNKIIKSISTLFRKNSTNGDDEKKKNR